MNHHNVCFIAVKTTDQGDLWKLNNVFQCLGTEELKNSRKASIVQMLERISGTLWKIQSMSI